jgi:chromosome segregation ATPase
MVSGGDPNKILMDKLYAGLERQEEKFLNLLDSVQSDKAIDRCFGALAVITSIRASAALVVIGAQCGLRSVTALGAAMYAYFSTMELPKVSPQLRQRIEDDLGTALETVINEAQKISAADVKKAEESAAAAVASRTKLEHDRDAAAFQAEKAEHDRDAAKSLASKAEMDREVSSALKTKAEREARAAKLREDEARINEEAAQIERDAARYRAEQAAYDAESAKYHAAAEERQTHNWLWRVFN